MKSSSFLKPHNNLSPPLSAHKTALYAVHGLAGVVDDAYRVSCNAVHAIVKWYEQHERQAKADDRYYWPRMFKVGSPRPQAAFFLYSSVAKPFGIAGGTHKKRYCR